MVGPESRTRGLEEYRMTRPGKFRPNQWLIINRTPSISPRDIDVKLEVKNFRLKGRIKIEITENCPRYPGCS